MIMSLVRDRKRKLKLIILRGERFLDDFLISSYMYMKKDLGCVYTSS